MKFTLSWLKSHLETDKTLMELAEGLTAIGLEVEGIDDPGATYAPFKVVSVEKADKHPDADRLKVCIVQTGQEKIQVVCGAPNARAGMKAIFAPDGSYIPGTKSTLKKGVIRGQESNGMLVAEDEMGLSDYHEGIIEVPDDTPIGTPFAALYGLDDPVIEINLTPNRADCAGVRGVARDLAAAGYGTLKPLDVKAVEGAFASPVAVSLKFEPDTQNACPHFVGRFIKGVTNGPSPEWLQRRLKSIGLRPISALVDITNFMTMDLGRPLHVFDADKLTGNIHVRLAKASEKLAALNDKTYDLTPEMTVVCDDRGVLALGGVIGGASTGCDATTKNVYLEAAYFDPIRTARTGRALGCESDARYRFERGIDPAFTGPGAEIATRLILELCGGSASNIVTAGTMPPAPPTVIFDPAKTKTLAGVELTEAQQEKILSALGFDIKKSGKTWTVQPPSWRADVMGAADIVEEIVRIHGYDKIPVVSVRAMTAIPKPAETPTLMQARRARAALSTRGLKECVTWSFMHHEHADLFGANDQQAARALRLVNPISADLDQMRPTPLANLLHAAQRNADRGFSNAALFEVGPAFATQKAQGQKWVAAGVRHLAVGDRHWSGNQASRHVDAFDAKADAMAVLAACGVAVERLQVDRAAPSWFHPGRSAVLRLGPAVLAVFGEFHPHTLENLDVKGPASGFEVYLDAIPQPRKKGTTKPPLNLSALQPVRRDFAFIVDEKVEAEALVKLIKSVDKNLIADVSVFDVYQGKGMESGKKSVAVGVVLQPAAQTLTDAEIEKISILIVDTATAKIGAKLRA